MKTTRSFTVWVLLVGALSVTAILLNVESRETPDAQAAQGGVKPVTLGIRN